jgi:hypothetical protein
MPVAQRKHRRTGALLPASPAGELLTGFAVHNYVDHLCKTTPGLCAYREMLGIPLPGPRLQQGLGVGKRGPRPVDGEENGIVHTPRRNSS